MLAKIAEVLTNFSTIGIASSIPRVHLNFTYDQNDIGADSWSLKVVLEGIEEIREDGKVTSKVAREWEVAGRDPNDCLLLMVKSIKAALDVELALKKIETQAVETAISYLNSDRKPEDLPLIWPQSKKEAASLELAEQEGEGWAAPLGSTSGESPVLDTFQIVSSRD